MAPKQIESADGFELAIQRALVEVWIMRQETGMLRLPTKISDPTDDFNERLATGVAFNRDTSVTFTDRTLQEDVARSLGLRDNEGAAIAEVEEKFDHVPEDVLEGSRLGRYAHSRARTNNVESEPLEDEVIEEFDVESEEDIITVGETEDLTDDQVKPLVKIDQSYRRVAFQEPDVKFAVCNLSAATALPAKLH